MGCRGGSEVGTGWPESGRPQLHATLCFATQRGHKPTLHLAQCPTMLLQPHSEHLGPLCTGKSGPTEAWTGLSAAQSLPQSGSLGQGASPATERAPAVLTSTFLSLMQHPPVPIVLGSSQRAAQDNSQQHIQHTCCAIRLKTSIPAVPLKGMSGGSGGSNSTTGGLGGQSAATGQLSSFFGASQWVVQKFGLNILVKNPRNFG